MKTAEPSGILTGVKDYPATASTLVDAGRFSGDHMFALYPTLKDERDGPGAFQTEAAAKAVRISEWIRCDKPGFRLCERQLSEGAWTLMRSTRPGTGLLSWTRINVRTPAELGVEQHRAAPEETASTIKTAALHYGAGAVGIAPMNQTYVNLREQGRPILFEDVDLPVITDEKLVIPTRMKWVVAIAIPMKLDLLAHVPTEIGDAAVALGYSYSVFVVSALAEFIRGLGYQAIPSVNDIAQSIPFALDAGLGEMGRTNKLITRKFGAAARLCKVFTDLPMSCDEPVRFGVAEYCRVCRRCAEVCPARALSFDAEPSFRTRGPWNNASHAAWFEDSFRCFQYWQKVGNGCGICMACCPFTQTPWLGERREVGNHGTCSRPSG
jgi:reductive dehalogenase